MATTKYAASLMRKVSQNTRFAIAATTSPSTVPAAIANSNQSNRARLLGTSSMYSERSRGKIGCGWSGCAARAIWIILQRCLITKAVIHRNSTYQIGTSDRGYF